VLRYVDASWKRRSSTVRSRAKSEKKIKPSAEEIPSGKIKFARKTGNALKED
jgi:hypothetical protein